MKTIRVVDVITYVFEIRAKDAQAVKDMIDEYGDAAGFTLVETKNQTFVDGELIDG